MRIPTQTRPVSTPLTYYPNQVNHCPGCGRTHWYVGRVTAECGFCDTVLMLQEKSSGSTLITRRE